jgi:magnesium transporter
MSIDPVQETTRLEIAAERSTSNVPIVEPSTTVEAIVQTMQGQRFESVAGVVVLDGDRFLGLIDTEDLFAADGSLRARDLMDSDPPIAEPGIDQEVAVWRAVQRSESCLVVVDNQRRFLGLIPPERIIEVLLIEHEEDMLRISGLITEISPARVAAEEPVYRRFLHRIPWLLVGMAGAFLAANIMGAFEEQLQSNVLLAFFVPSVVYLAAAVGVQSSTIVIRGLSVGVPLRSIWGRELAVGMLVSLAVSATFFPVVWLWWGDTSVAAIVSLSLVAACSVATIIAMLFPWLLQRAGSDPAFGSGPLATILQDLCTIALYLLIGSLLLSI